MSEKVRVLITGVGGGGHGRQVLKALKMAKTNYYIVGVDMSPVSIGLFDVDEAYTVPSASDERYISTILKLCLDKEIKVIVHGSEPELKAISNNRNKFKEAGIFVPVNSQEVIKLCMNKWETMEFLCDKGFSIPRTRLIEGEFEPELFDMDLPIVIKPSEGSGGSNNVFVAQEADELRFYCEHLLRQGKKVIAQEYIGTPEDEFTVGILSLENGDIVNSIAVQRSILSGLSNRIKVINRTHKRFSSVLVISSGVSQGRIGKYPEITSICEKIAEGIGSKGPLNIQCRFVGGKVYPFEINPRFSGTTSLRAMVGFNEPDILIRHYVLGESVNYNFEFEEGGYIVRGLEEKYISSKEKEKVKEFV